MIKSRERVQQFGEVFTPHWMVCKMLDLPPMPQLLREPATKFFEPCCGEGAFLTEILRRKLAACPDASFDALQNLFGIEIQLDNLVCARKNLAEIFAAHYHLALEDPRIWNILNRNVILGDALKFYKPAPVQNLFEEVLVLSDNPLADLLKENFGLTDDEIRKTVIISNPPYQEDNRGDTSNYARPVYHKFVETFHKTSDRAMVIHPARCLFNAGATPKDFNDRLLNDEHISVPIYVPDSRKVFPSANVDIKGGVAVTYRDANKFFGKIGIFTPFGELNSALHKVINRKDFRPLSEIIYTQKLYKFSRKFYEDNPSVRDLLTDGRTLKTNIFKTLPNFFTAEQPDDEHEYIRIYGIFERKRAFRFFRRDYLDDNVNFLKCKVFIPKAYGGAGALNENGPTMLVGLPLVGSTESFVTLGAFDNEAEAAAAMKFVKTKFARALLGARKVTQEATPDKWEFVPLQDFTAGSDIDWTAGVADINRQLYAKYGLDAREIEFIESKVKAMD